MRRSHRRLQRRLRPFRSTLLLLGVVLVLSGLWVAGRGLLAARELRALDRTVTALSTASTTSGGGDLGPLTRTAQDQSRKASAYTHDVVWKAWSRIPLVGPPMEVVSGVSSAAVTLTGSALPALGDAAVAGRGLRTPTGELRVQPLAALSPQIDRAVDAIGVATRQVQALPSTRFGFVNSSRARLSRQLELLTSRTRALSAGAAAAPELLGYRSPRRYLVVVQNNAESRASGGIVGAYGLIRVAQGKAALEAFGSDAELRQAPRDVIDLGEEWRSRYTALGQARDWREVTATPDFPTAAKAILALWRATRGQDLDGVISIDPPGMADVLQATGPVTARAGMQLSAAGIVSATLSDAYRDFPDKRARSTVLSEGARAMFRALVNGSGDPYRLAERLGRAIDDGHFKLYSADAATQARLAGTPVAGTLPGSAAPLLSVITQDGNADKLSYYLRRQISYQVLPAPAALDFGDGRGPQPQESALVTVRLTNTAPASGLPDYVAPAVDLGTGQAQRRGLTKVSLSVYLGRSGLVEGAAVDGRPTSFASQTEQGLSVVTLAVTLEPGASRTVQLAVRQPAQPGQPLLVLNQPLVTRDDLSITGREFRHTYPFN